VNRLYLNSWPYIGPHIKIWSVHTVHSTFLIKFRPKNDIVSNGPILISRLEKYSHAVVRGEQEFTVVIYNNRLYFSSPSPPLNLILTFYGQPIKLQIQHVLLLLLCHLVCLMYCKVIMFLEIFHIWKDRNFDTLCSEFF
jgi:hypothetical protein